MDTSLDDILSSLREGECSDDQGGENINCQEEFSLEQIRLSQGVTQVQVAERLGVEQPAVAKIEKRLDNKLSTLHAYIEALGGKLVLQAEFPD